MLQDSDSETTIMPSQPQKYHRKGEAPIGTYTFDTVLRHRLCIVFYSLIFFGFKNLQLQ